MSTERDFIHYVVMGVGINVGRQDFPAEIARTAACLEQECGRAVSRAELIVNVIKTFEGYYERFQRDGSLTGLLGRYNEMLAGKDGEVRVLDPKGEYRGISAASTVQENCWWNGRAALWRPCMQERCP